MDLIYIITYKCNLNCFYCPVKKKNLSISKNIIDCSLKLFENNQIKKIKFFGGEPLLEYEKLKYLVVKIRKIQPKIEFFLTTNGILLDKEKLSWIKKNNIHLSISLDGNEFTQLKNRRGQNSFKKIIFLLKKLPKSTVFNLVIAPNTARYFYYNFKYLIEKLGIYNFNILPAYYNSWSAPQFKILAKNFLLILDYIKKNYFKKKIHLKNLENFSDLSFFNRAIVIDCDGKIYNTNAFLATQLEKYKEKFKIGELGKIKTINDLKNRKINSSKINQLIDSRYIAINKQLDKILNDFIYKYKRII